MVKCLCCLVAYVMWVVPLHANTGAPLEMVKEHINKVLVVLGDPSFRGESGKKVKEEKIRTISEGLFDFVELSKRSLGQNWNRFNPDQRSKFVPLYKSLLQNAYSGRITSYTDEKVLFGKEIALSEKTVEVQTTLVTKTGDIAINYRLMQKDGQWKVYDVVIEAVSLINNYRAQFREILGNQSPAALLEVLRKKLGNS